jgi:hypothetical protein
MPKTKISEFSATPANNTDIDSINIAEGCAPSGINDAIRELMAQLKDFQTGAVGDSFNGPVGATTAGTGAFTTLSASSTATLSGLTASTALALDASKNVVSVTNTGTGSNVLATSPTLVTPALGTPSALVGTNITGTASGLTAGNVTTNANLTGAVTSVGNATSLGSFSSANLLGALTDETGTGSAVFATSPTLVTPILGTPTSATLTNATGLPIGTGVSGLGTGVATFLATPSSANLLAAVTDETGTGSLVFATSPTLVTPALGTPASGVVTNLTGTASININGTVGATTATTGAFTTLTTSSTVTHNGGTSNGVAYLNGSKVLTSGSALQFNGTNLGLGASASAWGNNWKAITVGVAGELASTVGGNSSVQLVNAAYNDNTNWLYTYTGITPARFELEAGGYKFYTASSGTAGGTISWTQGMTFNSTGLGMGTTAPNTRLEVNKAITFSNADTFPQFIVKDAVSGLGRQLGLGVDSAGFTFIQSLDRGNTQIPLVLQRYGSNVLIGTTTNNTSGGVLQISNGITFPATQSASSDANTLDDYEEGTWTPTVTASTSGTITTTDRGGTYTKIGNIVTVQGYFNVASVSSPVGDLRIGGLPFSTNASVGYGSVALQPYGFGTTSVVTAYYGLQVANQNYFAVRGLFNGAQVTTVANNVQASTGMQFTVTYQV